MPKPVFPYSTLLLGVLQRIFWTSLQKDLFLIHQALHYTHRLVLMQKLVVYQFIVVSMVQMQLREVFTHTFVFACQHLRCLASYPFLLTSELSPECLSTIHLLMLDSIIIFWHQCRVLERLSCLFTPKRKRTFSAN